MRERVLQFCVLASLIFLPGWVDIYRFRAEAPDQMRSPAALALAGATICNVAILTVALWAIDWLLRRNGKPRLQRAADIGLVAVGITAFDSLAWLVLSWGLQIGMADRVLIFAWVAVMLTALLTAVLFVLEGNRLIFRVLKPVFVIAAPLGIVYLSLTSWAVFRSPAWPLPRPTAERIRAVPQHRVIWIIFDEWDQRLTFDARPPDVRMPALDSFVRRAFVTSRAVSPALKTPESIASLLHGRHITDPRWGSSELEDIRTVTRSSGIDGDSTILSAARGLERNVGLLGWHLPYCSDFRNAVVECWQPLVADLGRESTLDAMGHQWYRLVREHWLRVIFDPKTALRKLPSRAAYFEHKEYVAAAHSKILERAQRMAADPSLGLVFIHWPLPHLPGVWDRNSDRFRVDGGSNYLDNLELVDQAIAEILRSIQSAGLAQRTSVILTADHPFRPDKWKGNIDWTEEESRLSQMKVFPYVPFILKLPGDEAHHEYNAPFNTVGTAKLILELLDGKFTSHRAVAAWIDQQAAQR